MIGVKLNNQSKLCLIVWLTLRVKEMGFEFEVVMKIKICFVMIWSFKDLFQIEMQRN